MKYKAVRASCPIQILKFYIFILNFIIIQKVKSVFIIILFIVCRFSKEVLFETLDKLSNLELKYLALAHFGIHDKPYLLIENAKESIEVWIKFVSNLPTLSNAEAAKVLNEWLVSNYKVLGIDDNTINNYIDNSHFEMQIRGIRNYLTK